LSIGNLPANVPFQTYSNPLRLPGCRDTAANYGGRQPGHVPRPKTAVVS
jgi:hypothetical protein